VPPSLYPGCIARCRSYPPSACVAIRLSARGSFILAQPPVVPAAERLICFSTPDYCDGVRVFSACWSITGSSTLDNRTVYSTFYLSRRWSQGGTSSTSSSSPPTPLSLRDSSQLTHSSHTSHRRHMCTLPLSHRPTSGLRFRPFLLLIWAFLWETTLSHITLHILLFISPSLTRFLLSGLPPPATGEATNLDIVIITLLHETICRSRHVSPCCGAVDVDRLLGCHDDFGLGARGGELSTVGIGPFTFS
jgi:hypothetical protein